MRAPLTREAIVASARACIEAGGADNLSLRGVARDLGVTAPALYAHVADKYDLLATLATEHFEGLVSRFEAIDTDDPLERLRVQSHAYVDHALESPELFRLMFRYPPVAVPGADAFPASARAFEAAHAATVAAIDSGQLRDIDPQLASMTIWAAVHGVAEILLLGFSTDAQESQALVATVVDTVLAGLRPT